MIGTSLGPYKIIEQIGSGGMGDVYLAEDARLGRKVAVKVLPAEFAGIPPLRGTGSCARPSSSARSRYCC